MVYREKVKLQSRDRAVSFHDVTEQVKEAVKRSGVKDGIAVVYSHHTTCSVITQECAFDMSMTGLETLQQDLVNVFCLLYTSPSPRDLVVSRMPSSA